MKPNMKEFMRELRKSSYVTRSAKDMLEYLHDYDNVKIKEVLYEILEYRSSLFQYLEDQENIWIDANFHGDYLDITNADIVYYHCDDLWSLMKKYNVFDILEAREGK